ncbi:glutathione s-transferase-related protein-like protein [Bisporella sp. PMI_857]|nr:glutathione s-transferase-related protein-like protein [Bisporella sp. PMI_857]
MSQDEEIILYHYSYSPFARRVVWYLNLGGISYSQCNQPPYLPRPDLNDIGTVYRRIPLLSIGRDIYCDTRLILKKLEELYPSALQISTSGPDQKAIERLLDHWAVDSGVFVRASQLIPSSTPLMKDPNFLKDREDFSGRPWTQEAQDKLRPEALVETRGSFELLETTLLADGREWILKTDGPSLADIEAVWPLHWLTTLRGALPQGYICPQTFPKVFAWIKRFDQTVKAAAQKAGKAQSIKGDEALKKISASQFNESEVEVDSQDPTGLKKGEEVEVWPIDSGFNHKDRGVLSGLTEKEIVIESKTKDGQVVRIHTPRHGFRVRRAGAGKSSKI